MIDDFFRCKPLSQRIEDNRDVDAGPSNTRLSVQTFGSTVTRASSSSCVMGLPPLGLPCFSFCSFPLWSFLHLLTFFLLPFTLALQEASRLKGASLRSRVGKAQTKRWQAAENPGCCLARPEAKLSMH